MTRKKRDKSDAAAPAKQGGSQTKKSRVDDSPIGDVKLYRR